MRYWLFDIIIHRLRCLNIWVISIRGIKSKPVDKYMTSSYDDLDYDLIWCYDYSALRFPGIAPSARRVRRGRCDCVTHTHDSHEARPLTLYVLCFFFSPVIIITLECIEQSTTTIIGVYHTFPVRDNISTNVGRSSPRALCITRRAGHPNPTPTLCPK